MLNKAKIREILEARFANDKCKNLADLPRPNALKDAFKAAKRIKEAIERDEKIAVVGDYDVDGVISCVIMAEFFDELGVNYEIKIPNRFKDGYGLNESLVNELNASLIITVDNGISAFEAALACQKRGINLIITDHHTPQTTLPEAFAIIDPKQTDDSFENAEICGAQVAWYLLAALKESCHLNFDLSEFIELLAVAIMGDMMELKDLNRVLVRKGIERINSSKRPAFRALKAFYQKDKFALDDISFLIAPLINSAGRMDDARLSFEFLYTKDYKKAARLLNQIVELNNARKSEEKRLFEESLKLVSADDSVVLVSGERWHEGVIGILASRLARHFGKPAFVFSENDGIAKGSGRTIGKIDILKLITTQKELFLGFGGHKGASGMSIEVRNLGALKANLNELVSKISPQDFKNDDEILGVLPLSEVDLELLDILEFAQPYGLGNARPLFEFRGVFIQDVRKIGKNENHLKLLLGQENALVDAVFFNFTQELNLGDEIAFLGQVNKNTYRGKVSAQIMVRKIFE